MSEGSKKSRCIVRVRHMLRLWREKVSAAATRGLKPDVPAGHMAVTVGTTSKRFVIPTTHLNHPLFHKLLLQAEEEYGFTNSGPLAIPCAEEVFEEILKTLARSDQSRKNEVTQSLIVDDFHKCFHLGFRNNFDCIADSRHFLQSPNQKSVW